MQFVSFTVLTERILLMIAGVSANSDHDTMQAAYVAGVDAFIPKPFNIQSFVETYTRLSVGGV